MILSENRSSLIEKLGKQKYLGMYSATAALTLFPTVALFARYRGSGPLLYKTSSLWQRGTAFGFKTAGVVALSQALITRGPIPEPSPNQDEKVKKVDVQGIYRVCASLSRRFRVIPYSFRLLCLDSETCLSLGH